jgi:drug/metabolite transporter (DMT)-like permease
VAIVLALLCSFGFGAADFLGGMLTKRAPVLPVVATSQLAGLLLVAPAVALTGGTLSAGAIGWGAMGGACGAVGVVLLYRGLAIGRMSVVAPTTAVLGAVTPVTVGLALGDRPGAVALAGVAIALAAVVLIAWVPEDPSERAAHRSGLPEAIGAGVVFGGALVAFGRAPHSAELWPVAVSRVVTAGLVIAAALAARRPLRPPRALGRGLVALGLMDAGSATLYLLAVHRGLLSIVAVVASLYPAGTVILARVLLRERWSIRQSVGLAAAAGAVALIAAG